MGDVVVHIRHDLLQLSNWQSKCLETEGVEGFFVKDNCSHIIEFNVIVEMPALYVELFAKQLKKRIGKRLKQWDEKVC